MIVDISDLSIRRCALASAVFRLYAYHLGKVLPGVMNGGDVEAAVSFPQSFAGLLFRPCADPVEEVVEVSGVADVHLPVPEELVFGVHVGEVLDWHVC